METKEKKDLITFIVQRKDGQRAIDTALKAGATGVTYFYAQGTGVRQRLGLMGLFIEAEKQVIMVVTPATETDKILTAVANEIGFHEPGRGFAYVQSVDRVIGFYQDRKA